MGCSNLDDQEGNFPKSYKGKKRRKRQRIYERELPKILFKTRTCYYKMNIEVDVEYCNKCGYLNKFEELGKHVKEKHPSVKIKGHEGRRGSFEISVNGTLVHSKLSTLAYPDYNDLSKIISEAEDGKSARTCKQQPITDCVIA